KSADLNSFLQWWDEHGINKTIPMPENDQAMRIMTIHKSKGLDFKVVVMPFCDWDFVGKQKPLLWCTTDKEPFSQLPLLPVEFSSKLGQSVFANQYYSELMHTYIDNLNVAYVAFTRARNEMHCFCKQPRPTAKGIITVNSLSSLLYTLLKETADGEGTYDDATQTFSAGVECDFSTKKENGKVTEQATSSKTGRAITNQPDANSADERSASKAYPVELLNNRLRIRHRIHNFNREETEITENPIDYGNLMHEIFSELQAPDEYQYLIDRLIQQGRITAPESRIIAGDLEAFGQLPEVKLWFDPQAKALNETTIITPTGALYRPDRVVLNGNHATVVDYKFGSAEHSQHLRQVEHYATLLKEMGYSCSGYLCYVKLKKVVTVC
ncbi:MAG: Dna2/Cas4 domain-containing protein, partial [Paludibacter sp.]|nr:Dna2/Cas4 domain-containing protein [Paludibacter sp.]